MFDLVTMNDVLVKATGRGDVVVMLWQERGWGVEADHFERAVWAGAGAGGCVCVDGGWARAIAWRFCRRTVGSGR